MSLSNASILEAFESFLVFERRLALNTVQAYMSDISLLSTFLKQRKQTLVDLTQANCVAFLEAEAKKKLHRSTLYRRRSALTAFLKLLEGRFQKSIVLPSESILPMKKENKLPIIMSQSQTRSIFSLFDQSTESHLSPIEFRNLLIFSTLYTLGLRVSELTELSWEHFSQNFSEVRILGKGDKTRAIPLPNFLQSKFYDYFHSIYPLLLRKNKTNFITNYCFFVLHKKTIKPFSRQAIFKLVKKFAAQHSLSAEFSPHKFRHSIATHLLNKGANLRMLQQFLGHESISTVQIYTHLDINALRKEYDLYHPRAI